MTRRKEFFPFVAAEKGKRKTILSTSKQEKDF
jgi:hypothetical protein